MTITNQKTTGVALWTLWIAGLVLTLLWDASGLDVWAMQKLASAEGFALQHHPVLSIWLHDRARTLATLVFLGMWALAVWPKGPWNAPQSDKLWLACLVTLNLLAVNLIKNNSLTSCPWDMRWWGGTADYVSHWRWGLADGGPGRCFPGGHASASLAFAPLVIAAWWPVRSTHRHRWSAQALLVWLVAIALTGGTQTLRGAHYPSHTAWTAVICCGMALAGWTLWHRRSQRVATNAP